MTVREPASHRAEPADEIGEEYRLRRAAEDAAVEPWALLKAVRDPDGQVVDFIYHDINRVAARQQRLQSEDLIGRSVAETLPEVARIGLIEQYAHCVETGEPLILDDLTYYGRTLNEPGLDTHRYEMRGVRVETDYLSLSWRDVNERYLAAEYVMQARERLRASADAMLDPQVLLEAVRDSSGTIVDFVYREVNRATCDYLGLYEEDLLGRGVVETMPGIEATLLASYVRCLDTGEPLILDDFSYDNEILADTRRYDLRATRATPTSITLTWRDVTERFQTAELLAEARDLQHKADALYRRSMDSAAVGMCLADLEGNFVEVNAALCEFFGYDAQTLQQLTWQELTAEDYLEADLANRAEILAGSSESYRMVKQFLHADGHPIWGDLSVSCVREADGQVEVFIGQITDITDEVQARERLVASEEHNRALAQGLQSELSSAAKYVQSVLPGDLDGQVSVSTRYLPSQTLGGDCFDFFWIDDDHLVVYLLDVSGHGVKSALVAVSVHNMLRSASLPTETMLKPDQVLTVLNHQFAMDRHDGNYFTIFYGVYQLSTATLSYAGGGHPPALLFTGGQAMELPGQSPPVGTFDHTAFTTTDLTIAPGSKLLLYSDGAYELRLDDGRWWSHKEFVDVWTRLAGSPDWTLDDLTNNLPRHSTTGGFNDDCCLLRVAFD